MRNLFFALCLILPTGLWAQSLPALYDVADVLVGDVLNIRKSPTTTASIIGGLAYDETGVEVVAINEEGDWGLINAGETAGWVSLRYLQRQPGQDDDGLPRPLACAGTEPFWSFNLGDGTSAEITWFDEEPVTFESVFVIESSNRTDRYAIFADGGDKVLTSVLGRARCSDGMSDKVYGLGIDILLTDESDVRFFSGCCAIAR